MSKHLEGQDLAALFDLDLDTGSDLVPAEVGAILCEKCKGRGNFVGYSGRIVGKCFACGGTGVARTVGVTLKADDCTKCAASGEYSPGRPCFACDGTGKLNGGRTTAAISVDAIIVAFATAQQKGIKAPKLRLAGFTFSRAPDTGRNAGSIYVKHTAGNYLGKVTAGSFHPSRECDDPMRTAIVAAAADPHAAAKAFGLKTGTCSCCGRELTNGESIELGIGPICRERYGWA